MDEEDYKKLLYDERIELLKNEKDDFKRLIIIRSFSSDDLMIQNIGFLTEEANREALIYSLSKVENKIKVIKSLTDEKAITSVILELEDNVNKVKQLKRVKNPEYRNMIIGSLNNAENELIRILDLLDNEKDKAIVISKISNETLKRQYIEKLTDEKCKSIIVMSLDDDEFKKEYINKVKDKAIRILLIASLKDKETRNKFLGSKNNTYSRISVPKGITVGIEIESEGENLADAYFIDSLMEGYHAKRDNSLQNGVEVTSSILTNSTEDGTDIYCLCKILNDLEQNISERCGGHIHIGADYLKTKEAYRNLVELWSNNEELIYLISNKKGEIPRDGTIEFATPISKKIEDLIDNGNFESYEDMEKDDFTQVIKEAQEHKRGKESIRTGINFLNLNTERPNTIEFRLPNGTIDANIWIENATLFGGIIAISQKISEIHEQDSLSKEDKIILKKFETLKKGNIPVAERLEIFLDLCVPEEFRQVFVERYEENSKILSEKIETKKKLEEYIADKPIDIYGSIGNIAETRIYSTVKNAEAELISNYLEFESPSLDENTKKGKEI